MAQKTVAKRPVARVKAMTRDLPLGTRQLVTDRNSFMAGADAVLAREERDVPKQLRKNWWASLKEQFMPKAQPKGRR